MRRGEARARSNVDVEDLAPGLVPLDPDTFMSSGSLQAARRAAEGLTPIRGQALGVTYQRPDSDRYNYPEAYLRARIVGMLGGRAAEEIVYGTKTTGAESDIERRIAVLGPMRELGLHSDTLHAGLAGADPTRYRGVAYGAHLVGYGTGEVVEAAPAVELPMAQRYFLF